MIHIRRYQAGDEIELRKIFFHTIRNINIKDYSKEQVTAWAPDEFDATQWQERVSAINPFIATIDHHIVGYADIQPDGHIDHFFCHWQHQGQGVGKTLMQTILSQAKHNNINRLYSHASITAKPFFEHFGFTMVKQQSVEIRGQILTNFVMEKFV